MKFVVKNENVGTIEYKESFWTGKKEIILNGEQLKKIGKQEFVYTVDGENKVTKLNGNFLSGASIVINGHLIQVVPKIGLFEILVLIFAFFLPLVCASIDAFVVVLPIVGGAIGGIIYALVSFAGITFIKQAKSSLIKFVVFLLTTIVSFIVGIIAGLILVGIIVSI